MPSVYLAGPLGCSPVTKAWHDAVLRAAHPSAAVTPALLLIAAVTLAALLIAPGPAEAAFIRGG